VWDPPEVWLNTGEVAGEVEADLARAARVARAAAAAAAESGGAGLQGSAWAQAEIMAGFAAN
jgi:hypothetical protein